MSKKTESTSVVEAMFAAGSHFGYSKTRRHPSVAKYIFTTKNKVDLVDLEKTEMMLDEAKAFIKELSSKGKQIVFVGVKPEARAKMREAASSIDMPFVTERWVGGAMTNFPEIKKRIQKLEELKSQREKGELDKYTKKERLLIDEQITKMDKLFLGLSNLKKAEALFVIDAKREHIAVTEAHKMGIPVVALVNTDTNIKTIEYPIIGNDSSMSSIAFFVDQIVSAYKDGIMASAQ